MRTITKSKWSSSKTSEDGQLSIEIFEVQGDNFSIVDDEDLAKRLLAHIDQISEDLEDEKD